MTPTTADLIVLIGTACTLITVGMIILTIKAGFREALIIIGLTLSIPAGVLAVFGLWWLIAFLVTGGAA